MTRLTLVSAPKPFGDPRIATIQSNAVGSWARLNDVDLVLVGEGTAVAALARENGALHVPAVRTNEQSTPLIPAMIRAAMEWGRGELLGIINTDIIVMSDFVDAALQVSSKLTKFLVLGRRWDLEIRESLSFATGWGPRLREEARTRGKLHKPTGSDIFVFPRGLYSEVPDLAVGRAGWDNWMIFEARRLGIPVVDITESAMMVHQDHDYAHLPGGVAHYSLPETDENVRLAGGTAAIRYTILDATHRLSGGHLLRPLVTREGVMRRMEILLRRALSFLPPRTLEGIARPQRWRKRWQRLIDQKSAQQIEPNATSTIRDQERTE